MFGRDPGCGQYPAAPAIQADDQPALAAITGGIQVQRIAAFHRSTQLWGSHYVQSFEPAQEAVAQIRDGSGGQLDVALGVQLGANLFALHPSQIARQPHVDDQVIAVALPRLDHLRQRQRADYRTARSV